MTSPNFDATLLRWPDLRRTQRIGNKAILTMHLSYREYTEMAEYFAQNGFTEQQSETLVQVIAGLLSRIEAYFERIRKEDKADRERIRKEDKADREHIREQDQQQWGRLEAKIDAIQLQVARWSIATLSTLVLTIIGASVAYILSLPV